MARVGKSTAVMATRRSAATSLNLFPTPPWATRSLVADVLVPVLAVLDPLFQSVWEPACGAGHMALPLHGLFRRVFSSDVADWGFGDVRNLDFSMCTADDAPWSVDWIITNPPFTIAETFARRGLAIARRGVALLCRLQWLEGEERYFDFYREGAPYRPTLVAVFAERVPMIEGAWDPEASSATSYAWIIWIPGSPALGPTIPTFHIPPGAERRHTRPGDMALATPGESKRRLAAKKERERADGRL